MATLTKEKVISVRLTLAEKMELESTAALLGTQPGTLAASYTREGVRRSRFPAIDFRDGVPGRVAYLAGSRWPVWMIVDLVKEHGGDVAAAAAQMRRPPALVRLALAYAAAYPREIKASADLHAARDFADMKRVVPELEQL